MFWEFFIFVFVLSETSGFRSAFDQELYKNVLDAKLCREQLAFLANNSLSIQFLDASGKIPPGILSGNINDLGDYYQCLSINADVRINNADQHIQGKYCTIMFPLDQTPTIPELPELPEWPGFPEWPDIPGWPDIPEWPGLPGTDNPTDALLPVDPEIRRKILESANMHQWAQTMAGAGQGNKPKIVKDGNGHTRIFPMVINANAGAMMAVCVPKVCTATEAFDFFRDNVPFINVTYYENYCRLPEDRPFAPVDYVAIAFFSLIGCLAITSTLFDLYSTFIIKKPLSNLVRCFSVYTNTRRFLTFHSPPDALECVDGIRAISMLWVVVGHTYSMTLLGFIHNITEALAWLRLFTSTWVNSAPLTVDTFFLLSGILAVYSTIGKITRPRFIRSIHLFYINRLLRMFPLLAAVVLLQASVFNHVSDGPFWQNIAQATENCRQYWWAALLHVQNYVNPVEICLGQTWYLSVDTQLYFVCPIVLVWLFGRKLFAWSALCLILVLALTSASVYSFTYNFTAALVHPNRIAEFADYLKVYYFNTLTRAPPFFLGMICGYILHLYRGRKIRISKIIVVILWALAMTLMSFCVFSIYPVMQLDHDIQMLDNFLNAYMRSLWAMGVGWIIFACVHGYGGPVNWFLSLSMWKLPARLSYAMYLIHLPIIMIANGSWVKSHYFTNGDNLYRFASDILLTFVAAFILCILIDAPFSTLQKMLVGGKKKPASKPKTESQEYVDDSIKTKL